MMCSNYFLKELFKTKAIKDLLAFLFNLLDKEVVMNIPPEKIYSTIFRYKRTKYKDKQGDIDEYYKKYFGDS